MTWVKVITISTSPSCSSHSLHTMNNCLTVSVMLTISVMWSRNDYRIQYMIGIQLLLTRRPASAHRTVRCQFQAIGQPVSRMQASDAMKSWLPCYEAKCVQCRCFQWGSVPLRSDIKGTELPPANILISLERQLIALQLCRWQFLYNETLQQTSRPLLSKLVWKTTNLGIWSPFWGS